MQQKRGAPWTHWNNSFLVVLTSSETVGSNACLLVGEREATWPTQDLVKPSETQNKACSKPTLRILSDVLLQQVARSSQTTVKKDVQKVKSQRHSQWSPLSKLRENHLQCMQYPPKSLEEGSSTWRKAQFHLQKDHRRFVDLQRREELWRASSRMRKKSRNPASKESSGLREKAKGGLSDATLALFNKLEQSRSLWAVHGSNRRRSSKRMITLDPNHFGFDGRRGQRGGSRSEETSKWRENLLYPGPTSMVVSWVERCQVKVTSGGKIKERLRSQGQPKWWRAGQGAFLVNEEVHRPWYRW